MIAALAEHDLVATHAGAREITLAGTADARVAAALQAWLLAVVAEVARAPEVTELVVDVTALEFMTAGCVKAFVPVVDALIAAAPHAKLRFVTSDHYAWQRRSLAALACLASNTIIVGAAVTSASRS